MLSVICLTCAAKMCETGQNCTNLRSSLYSGSGNDFLWDDGFG